MHIDRSEAARRKRLARTGIALAALGAGSSAALAQGVFSIDWQGPPKGAPDACTGAPPTTEGDLLRAFFGVPVPGPSPTPCIYASGGMLGLPLYPGAVGLPPGAPGFIELDAVSFGRDARMRRPPSVTVYTWFFSVDEFATGVPPGFPPSVLSEGAFGALEASADVFIDGGIGAGPICIPAAIAFNTDIVDGDGLAPFGGPGVGLFEPNPPGAGLPDIGTNLDALDVDTPNLGPPAFPVYFSLDSTVPDALEGFFNVGSALANGLGVGGDVFVTPAPFVVPFVFAPAGALGLDLFGPDSDDIDALVLWDNGNGIYDPPTGPYSWLGATPTDMLFFSVRRGSALVGVGVPDSLCGVPIEPGDILAPPWGGAVLPGIWIPAESLALSTRRAGYVTQDELDALDVLCTLPGDVDGDGDIDLTDLSILLSNFGCVPPPACPGDVDGDGDVDLADLSILLTGFGLSC